MTNSELSNEFDVLYNNITSNQAPGLDEYEKSVFLTKAQDEIIKAYFNPALNKTQEGFDGNERRHIDFSNIIEALEVEPSGPGLLDPRSNTKTINLRTNIMMILNEFVMVTRGDKTIRLTVVPINYIEYNRLMSKPFKRPLQWQAWRLISQGAKSGGKADLIVGPSDTIISYTVRYVRKPRAIILSDLDGITLGGGSSAQECELDPILHPEILQRAVELAKAAYIGDLDSQLTLGVNSATEKGIVGR